MDYPLLPKVTVAVFAKKRVLPEELKARLLAVQRDLFDHEEDFRQRAAKAREAAKASLRLGDEQGFHRDGHRYSLAARQREMVRGMLLSVRHMLDVVEAQRGLKEIASIGHKLTEAQRRLGIDAKPLEQTLAQMRHGVDYVNQASVQLMKTMKVYALDESSPEELEAIRARLLAEVMHETTVGKRHKQEIHEEADFVLQKKG